MQKGSGIFFLLSFAIMLISTAIHAESMRLTFKDKTVDCAYDVFYFFTDGKVTWSDGLQSHEKTVSMKDALLIDADNTLSLRIPTLRPTFNVKFERSKGEYTVTYPPDKNGDYCSISAGFKNFLEHRRDMVREWVCGNDPSVSCEREFFKLCGRSPTEQCAAKNRILLK